MLAHRNSHHIHSLVKADGSSTSSETEVSQEFLSYFMDLLGPRPREIPLNPEDVERYVGVSLSQDSWPDLLSEVFEEEICRALFSMSDDKAPGPDGFTVKFFRQAWDIVKDDFIEAVRSFFQSGKLLGEINATIISLVPKIPHPDSPSHFRPISCCNVVYKVISKILANRLKRFLPQLVDVSQTAFVPGRSIGDNILLAQEFLHRYHLQKGPSRCALKVDLSKAYDSVDWDFLLCVLRRMNFPPRFCAWIKACVSTPRFSVKVNGQLHGFFAGGRGLRQGDPLSPYLFVLVMQVLHGIVAHHTRVDDFRFHWKCDRMGIAMLMFADDLLLFSHGDQASVRVLKSCLDRFTALSGLCANPAKSDCFVCCDDPLLRSELVQVSGFRQGTLPIRYLGIPLISKQLTYGDCRPILDRVRSRISSWRGRLLSFAGRLQLAQSVLSTIHVYWASIFILPKKVIRELERSICAFLWSGPDLSPHKVKVAWRDICFPKDQGGLGLRPLFLWNQALVTKLIWRVLQASPESLWVRWIHSYRVRDSCFWLLTPPYSCPWYWRKILNLRGIVSRFFGWRIGDGSRVSLWYDQWHPLGVLVEYFSRSLPRRLGIDATARVASLISHGTWQWPSNESSPEVDLIMDSMPSSPHVSSVDCVRWLPASDGLFSVSSALQVLRPSRSQVPWARLVWHSSGVPSYAFILWMAIQGRLSTLDRLNLYLPFPNRCYLCRCSLERHSHLFFSCSYSSQVLQQLRRHVKFPWPWRDWDRGVFWAACRWKGKAPWMVAHRLILQAAVYFIWRERNNRCFRDSERSASILAYQIQQAVWVRLSSMQFPRSLQSAALIRFWRLPPSCMR